MIITQLGGGVRPIKPYLSYISLFLVNSIGRRNCEIIMEVVCFQMLDFGTSKSNSEVSKSNSNI